MRILKIILKVLVMLAAFTFFTMVLWNDLIPEIFKGPTITYFQALGLLALAKILFSGFGGGFRGGWRGRHWHWKKFEEKLANMTPEEREKYKAKFDSKCM